MSTKKYKKNMHSPPTNHIGVHLSDSCQHQQVEIGEEFDRVDDSVYLGSRIMRNERDFEVGRGKHGELALS